MAALAYCRAALWFGTKIISWRQRFCGIMKLTFPDDALTANDFLGGKINLLQPKDGYRAGVDPVLLAASVPAQPGQSVLELGCGAGAAALCLGARVRDLHLTGVELQPDYADLARRNSARNQIELEVFDADLTSLPDELRQRQFDHVIMNPPYFDRQASTQSRNAGKDIAFGGETPLSDWLTTAAKRLAPKGTLSLIQRIERLPEVLAHCTLGSISVLPLAARDGRAASLFILQARKGGRADFRLLAPLIMHQGTEHTHDSESYTVQLRSILRDGVELRLGN